jgi:hypothetical protein
MPFEKLKTNRNEIVEGEMSEETKRDQKEQDAGGCEAIAADNEWVCDFLGGTSNCGTQQNQMAGLSRPGDWMG